MESFLSPEHYKSTPLLQITASGKIVACMLPSQIQAAGTPERLELQGGSCRGAEDVIYLELWQGAEKLFAVSIQTGHT